MWYDSPFQAKIKTDTYLQSSLYTWALAVKSCWVGGDRNIFMSTIFCW